MGSTAAILIPTLASLHDLLSDEQVNRVVLIAVAVIAMWFMMLSLRRRQQQGQRPHREPAPESRLAHQADMQLRRDLDDLLVELQELSRKISAEIDTRFAKLEAAMRDADRRIAVLNRLNRGQEAASSSEGGSGRDPDGRHQVVYELADAGFSPVEIARDLGRTPGEVELILNLRNRPEAPRPQPDRQG